MNFKSVKAKMEHFRSSISGAMGTRLGKRYEMQSENCFNELLRLEGRRSERSRKAPLLMLLDISHFGQDGEKWDVLNKITPILFSATREIDVKGWYKFDSTLGVLFTETERRVGGGEVEPDAMMASMRQRLTVVLGSQTTNNIKVSCKSLSSNYAKPASTDPFDIATQKSLQ